MIEADVVMTVQELNEFLAGAFPGAPRLYAVEAVGRDGIRMRLPYDAAQIRPGGTLSGPTMMGLADGAAWLATLSRIGPVALAVTSHLSIDFLAKPGPADLLGPRQAAPARPPSVGQRGPPLERWHLHRRPRRLRHGDLFHTVLSCSAAPASPIRLSSVRLLRLADCAAVPLLDHARCRIVMHCCV